MKIALAVIILLISSFILPSFQMVGAATVDSVTVTDLDYGAPEGSAVSPGQQILLSSIIQIMTAFSLITLRYLT